MINHIYKYSLLLIYFFTVNLSGQNENNIWCFGNNASLNFNTSSVSVGTSAFNGMYSGANATNEGVSAISDVNGNLLFYTDGQSVYDKNNNLMPNGSGLLGSASSTQSALIVPKPGSNNLYFVFTVDAWGGPNLIRYNIVDINLTNGSSPTIYGNVVAGKKNLNMPVSFSTNHYAEKIAAIPKSNGLGYWLVAHLSQETAAQGTYVVWSLDCSSANDGISEHLINGQRQSIGTACTLNASNYPFDANTLGYMKFSPDGNKLAWASLLLQKADVCDFNTTTGVISNVKTINSTSLGTSKPYGLEFSSNSQYLYLSDLYNPIIFVYDIGASNINASTSFSSHSFSLSGSLNGGWSFYALGALQLAPNGAMYCALPGRNHLAEIVNTNSLNPAITENAVYLNINSYCAAGLPTMVSPFITKINSLSPTGCGNFMFNYSGNLSNSSFQWNFGDGTTSNQISPSHQYLSNGTFNVNLTISDFSGCSRVFSTNVTASSSMSVSILGAISDTMNVCVGDSLTLIASGAQSFSWNNGVNNDSNIVINPNSGYYTATGTNSNGCSGSDSIFVNVNQLPTAGISGNSIICPNSFVTLTSNPSPNSSYSWSGPIPSNSQTLTTNIPGTYTLTETNSCGSSNTTINVISSNVIADFNYSITNNFLPTTVSFTNTSTNNQINNWSFTNGDTMNTVDANSLFNTPGDYSVELIVTNSDGCKDTVIKTLTIPDFQVVLIIPNIFTPNGDSVNDTFYITAKGITDLKLEIFNRWGQFITEVTNPLIGWNGREISDGTYYYLITGKTILGENIKKGGFLEIIH